MQSQKHFGFCERSIVGQRVFMNKINENAFTEDEQSMQELASVIAEGMKEQQLAEVDPFEIYAQIVRSSIHANTKNFNLKFSKGHELLLRELSEEKEFQKKKGLISDKEEFNF